MTNKDNRDVLSFIIYLWILTLFSPVIVIAFKFVKYLLDKPFEQWTLMYLWIVVIPLSSILVFVFKKLLDQDSKTKEVTDE